MSTSLCTTRFTDETWEENCNYRKKYKSVGCIYATPFLLDVRVPKRSRVYVIEMNNSENRIMGIGLVRNYAIAQKYRVYSNEDYNRYVFLGKYRLDRSQITDTRLLERLEQFCFHGKGHQKRLRGITRICSQKWLEWGKENWCMQVEKNKVYVPHILMMIDGLFRKEFQLLCKSEIHW